MHFSERAGLNSASSDIPSNAVANITRSCIAVRFTRFIAGRPASKDAYSQSEANDFCRLDRAVLAHFQSRFAVKGKIQGYFQVCEASKCIDELFLANKKTYCAFSGNYCSQPATDPDIQLDPRVNTPATVRSRYIKNIITLCNRYPLILLTMRITLPVQLAICDNVQRPAVASLTVPLASRLPLVRCDGGGQSSSGSSSSESSSCSQSD